MDIFMCKLLPKKNIFSVLLNCLPCLNVIPCLLLHKTFDVDTPDISFTSFSFFFFYIFKAIFHLLRFGHWDIGFVTEYLNLETHITSTSISLFRILLLMQCSIHKYIVRKQILTTFDKN